METGDALSANGLTDPAGAVVFDTSSGISLEEQREILAGINAMAGANRLAPEAAVTQAKKRGVLFPLLVNIAALLLLAAGFTLLSRLHVREEQNIRDSSAAFGLTERKLIQEIRREASSRLSEFEQSRAGLDEAMEELRQLSGEQDLAARVESQLAGLYAGANRHISGGRLDEALATIKTMKDFLNAPAFRGIRSLETGRRAHLTAIATMEEAVAEAGRLKAEAASMAGGAASAELRNRNSELEEEIEGLLQSIGLLTAEGSDMDKSIARYAAENSDLRARNASQQETLNRRNTEITAVRNESAAKDRRIADMSNNISSLTSQAQGAEARASRSDAALEQQRSAYAALQTERDDLRRRSDAALEQQRNAYAALQTERDDLRRRSDAALEQQRSVNAALQAERDDLRRRNETLASQLNIAREAARAFLAEE